MSYSIMGEQIQKFRKELGLTQRELGEAIGVSSSAVSQWESGGTPDVSLLPAIADRLHVPIDALFGREGGEAENMNETMARWIRTVPEDKQMDQLCRMILEIFKATMANIGPDSMGYLRSGDLEHFYHEMILMASYYVTAHGEMIGTFADDVSWVGIFPEPEAGYAAHFAETEAYRDFFSIIAKPNVLEILLHLASIDEKYYTPGAIAKRMGISLEAVEEALRHMVKAQLVRPLNMEDESGTLEAYVLCKEYPLIPFLYLSRIMLQTPDFSHLKWNPRGKPMLKLADK